MSLSISILGSHDIFIFIKILVYVSGMCEDLLNRFSEEIFTKFLLLFLLQLLLLLLLLLLVWKSAQ